VAIAQGLAVAVPDGAVPVGALPLGAGARPAASSTAPAATSVRAIPMLAAEASAGSTGATRLPALRHQPRSDLWAMAGALTMCAVLGVWMGPLGTLLQQAAITVTGTP
jgi:hypothetical protein